METININIKNNDIQGNVFRGEKCQKEVHQGNSGRNQNRVQSNWSNRNDHFTVVVGESKTERSCEDATTRSLQGSYKRAIPRLILWFIIVLLGMVAIVAFFSEPVESSNTWLADFLISKIIAIAAYFAIKAVYHKIPESHA